MLVAAVLVAAVLVAAVLAVGLAELAGPAAVEPAVELLQSPASLGRLASETELS